MDPQAVVSALADLAPVGGAPVYDVTRGGGRLVWLPREADRVPRGPATNRLAGLDTLHREARILRLGWGFLIGAVPVRDAVRKVCLPLMSQPVRLEPGFRGYR